MAPPPRFFSRVTAQSRARLPFECSFCGLICSRLVCVVWTKDKVVVGKKFDQLFIDLRISKKSLAKWFPIRNTDLKDFSTEMCFC